MLAENINQNFDSNVRPIPQRIIQSVADSLHWHKNAAIDIKSISNGRKIKPDYDTLLMLKAADGSKKAFEYLYHKYFPIMKRFFASRIGHHILLEDLVQKAFTRIWEQRKSFRAESSFQTYLFSVAKNMLSEEEKYFHKTNTARLEVVPSFLYEQMNNEGDAHHSDMTRPL